jgi:hypothetical protein
MYNNFTCQAGSLNNTANATYSPASNNACCLVSVRSTTHSVKAYALYNAACSVKVCQQAKTTHDTVFSAAELEHLLACTRSNEEHRSLQKPISHACKSRLRCIFIASKVY